MKEIFLAFSIASIIIVLILVLIIGFIAYPWILIYIGTLNLPDPPRPEITYGEFPFRLEYEINGQRNVVEDTLICEYDGIGMNEGSGKYRKWKERLASGNKRVTLLKVSDTQEIYYSVGYAAFYMGDMDKGVEHNFSFPDASSISESNTLTHDRTVSARELQNKYKIKLISWDYTKPISNTFPLYQQRK